MWLGAGDYTGGMSRRELASAIVRGLREHPEGVVSAYLFGSHALGRAHRESDVDVGVVLDRTVLPTAEERFERRVRLTSNLIAATSRPAIDLIVLNDVPPQLARQVLFTGRRVFCADEARDHEFLRVTMLRAADLEPFLRRVRRTKLGAIAR